MADTTWIASTLSKTLKATLDGTEVVRIIHDPSGTPMSQRTRVSDVRDYILAQANTWTAAQTLAQGTITANAPQINGTVTWNNSGVTFTAWRLAVTSTASASASLLMDLLVGGSSVFSVRRDGTVTSPAKAFFSGTAIGEDGAGIVTMRDAGAVAWTATSTALSGADTFLLRDAANVVAQRNGATAQAFRVYGTWTNASNYERGALNTGADFIELAAETAGTGDDDLDVRLTPAGTGRVRFGAHSALAAETVTGFITIKDSGGTTRKLAVVS